MADGITDKVCAVNLIVTNPALSNIPRTVHRTKLINLLNSELV